MRTSNGWKQPVRCAVDSMYRRRTRLVKPTATPGLVLTEWYSPRWEYPKYGITHQRSGWGVGAHYRALEQAQQVAAELGQLVDWTQPGRSLARLITDEEFAGNLAEVLGEE